jgi:hypothetical protein
MRSTFEDALSRWGLNNQLDNARIVLQASTHSVPCRPQRWNDLSAITISIPSFEAISTVPSRRSTCYRVRERSNKAEEETYTQRTDIQPRLPSADGCNMSNISGRLNPGIKLKGKTKLLEDLSPRLRQCPRGHQLPAVAVRVHRLLGRSRKKHKTAF